MGVQDPQGPFWELPSEGPSHPPEPGGRVRETRRKPAYEGFDAGTGRTSLRRDIRRALEYKKQLKQDMVALELLKQIVNFTL